MPSTYSITAISATSRVSVALIQFALALSVVIFWLVELVLERRRVELADELALLHPRSFGLDR